MLQIGKLANAVAVGCKDSDDIDNGDDDDDEDDVVVVEGVKSTCLTISDSEESVSLPPSFKSRFKRMIFLSVVKDEAEE